MSTHIKEFSEEHVELLVQIIENTKCDLTLAEHQLVKKGMQLEKQRQEFIEQKEKLESREEDLRYAKMELVSCQQKIRALET